MSTSERRPVLPEVFPDQDIEVERERHLYETFQESGGAIIEKREYVLDKAPIDAITEVQGIHDGQSITFDESRYDLIDYVAEFEDTFTYDSTETDYELTRAPDSGSVSIEDEDGVSYTDGVDFSLVNPDDIWADTVRWDTGASTPTDGDTFTVSYERTFENSKIKWNRPGNRPDAGSFFYVSYRSDSIISRLLDAGESELISEEDVITELIESKLLGLAEGDELDEIGKLFGSIGARDGRNDDDYSEYLGSIVQSFVSRGTVNGIKVAIAAATGYTVDDITIDEDFQNNSYEIVVEPIGANTENIKQIAEISDPSGVGLDAIIQRISAEVEFAATADSETLASGDLGTSTLGADKMGVASLSTGTLDSGRLG